MSAPTRVGGLAPHLVRTPEELTEVVERFLRYDSFVVDVETTLEGPHANEVMWIGLATYGDVVLVPIGHPHGKVLLPERTVEIPDPTSIRPYKNNPSKFTKPRKVKRTYPPVFDAPPEQIRPDVAFDILRPLFFSALTKVGHNLKFDLMSIAKYYGEVPPGPYADTIVLTHLLDEGKPEYSLKYLICAWLLPLTGRDPQVRKKFYPNLGKVVGESGLHQIAAYLAKDVCFTWIYWRTFYPKLVDQGLTPAFEAEMALYPALMAAERRGVYLDANALTSITQSMRGEMRQVEIDVWRICGEQFSLTLRDRKAHYLFGDKSQPGCQGLKPLSYTDKTGVPQVNQALLKHYAEENDLCRLLLEWGERKKMLEFAESLLEKSLDGRVHTSFNQHRTETGRLSSSQPNLQQIPRPKKWVVIDGEKVKPPKGTQLREAFIATPGYQLVVADYDQIELRCIAYLSKDPEMVRLFSEGLDIHAEAAASMLELPAEEVDDDLRQVGKAVNFSVGYGASEFRLASLTGRTVDEARGFIEKYYERFSKVRPWKAQILIEAVRQGDPANPGFCPPYIDIPPFGRRRRVPELFSVDQKVRSSGERQVINAVVQGFASSIMKMALSALHDELNKRHPSAHILLTVHDEVMVEAPADEIEAVRDTVVRCMEGVSWGGQPVLGPVPLIASAGIGNNWVEAK